MQHIERLTKQLIESLSVLNEQFEAGKNGLLDEFAFPEVKEKSTPIFNNLEEWSESVRSKVKLRQINFPIQLIDTAKVNMKSLIMHSFYFDIRTRQYKEMYRSIKYTFYEILKEVESPDA